MAHSLVLGSRPFAIQGCRVRIDDLVSGRFPGALEHLCFGSCHGSERGRGRDPLFVGLDFETECSLRLVSESRSKIGLSHLLPSALAPWRRVSLLWAGFFETDFILRHVRHVPCF